MVSPTAANAYTHPIKKPLIINCNNMVILHQILSILMKNNIRYTILLSSFWLHDIRNEDQQKILLTASTDS